jgi:hypothetical protein
MNEAEQGIAEHEHLMRELVENNPLFSVFMLVEVDAALAGTLASSCSRGKKTGQGTRCPSRASSDQIRKFASAAPRANIFYS